MERDRIKLGPIISLNQGLQVFRMLLFTYISDHRTNLTLYGIEKMLNGELLDQFIEEYLDKIYNAKINELLETEKSS